MDRNNRDASTVGIGLRLVVTSDALELYFICFREKFCAFTKEIFYYIIMLCSRLEDRSKLMKVVYIICMLHLEVSISEQLASK